MCVAVPMQVIESSPGWALCSAGDDHNHRERVDVRLVGDQPPGTWLLVFLGAARDILDEQRAKQTRDALEALRAAQQGLCFEHLFADLVGREPELPEFLRDQVRPSRKS